MNELLRGYFYGGDAPPFPYVIDDDTLLYFGEPVARRWEFPAGEYPILLQEDRYGKDFVIDTVLSLSPWTVTMVRTFKLAYWRQTGGRTRDQTVFTDRLARSRKYMRTLGDTNQQVCSALMRGHRIEYKSHSPSNPYLRVSAGFTGGGNMFTRNSDDLAYGLLGSKRGTRSFAGSDHGFHYSSGISHVVWIESFGAMAEAMMEYVERDRKRTAYIGVKLPNRGEGDATLVALELRFRGYDYEFNYHPPSQFSGVPIVDTSGAFINPNYIGTYSSTGQHRLRLAERAEILVATAMEKGGEA